MKSHAYFKYILIATISLVIGSSLLLLSSCGGGGSEPEPSARDKATKNLTASPWKVNSVTVDGTDKTAMFAGLTITFAGSNFTASNGGLVWPSNGTWSFTSDNANAFMRSDGLTIDLTSLSETSLTMALTWSKTTLGSGRVESISGQHIFIMKK